VLFIWLSECFEESFVIDCKALKVVARMIQANKGLDFW